MEWVKIARSFHLIGHAIHASGRGTISVVDPGYAWSGDAGESGHRRTAKKWPPTSSASAMRQGTASTAVMLHLRSCYVSKAAILTVPVHPVPVENRSPA